MAGPKANVADFAPEYDPVAEAIDSYPSNLSEVPFSLFTGTMLPTETPSLFPPTIKVNVQAPREEIRGGVPDSCHVTAREPDGSDAPGAGLRNLTSAETS